MRLQYDPDSRRETRPYFAAFAISRCAFAIASDSIAAFSYDFSSSRPLRGTSSFGRSCEPPRRSVRRFAFLSRSPSLVAGLPPGGRGRLRRRSFRRGARDWRCAPDAKACLLHVADRLSVEIGPEPARDRRHEVEKDADRFDPISHVQGAPQGDMMCARNAK